MATRTKMEVSTRRSCVGRTGESSSASASAPALASPLAAPGPESESDAARSTTPPLRRPPPSRSRASKSSPLLAPITPIHQFPVGKIDVDGEQTRVVYLAPVTCVAAEKFFSRTNGNGAVSSGKRGHFKGHVSGVIEEGAGGRDRTNDHGSVGMGDPAYSPLHMRKRALQKLLTRLERREQAPANAQENRRASAFHQPDVILEVEGSSAHSPDDVIAKLAERNKCRLEDEEINRLRQKVHLMPITDDEHESFWEAMKEYQRMKMEYRASIRHDQSSPITFNMQAAWDNSLRENRHLKWVHEHDARIISTRLRKTEEDEKFDQRMLTLTTEYRAQMRLLREIRQRLINDAERILPPIFLCAVTQKLFGHLLHSWKIQRLNFHLRRMVKFWRNQKMARNGNVVAAHIIIHWLQKSVAVKGVAFRVFRGIRTYVRRTKQLQRLWKIKTAKRYRSFLLLEKMWIELETELVDKAIGEYEERQAKDLNKGRRRKNNNPDNEKDAHAWLITVSPTIREEVIRAFVRDKEDEYIRQFRQQEEDLFPHLVQTLRGENPNRSRSYIKAMASGYALLGCVYTKLLQVPGAVEDTPCIKPFDMHNTPILQLIEEARARVLSSSENHTV